MTRAVRRGMARRKLGAIGKVGIDETSFRKRHEYVTVATDTETGYVLYVGDKRKLESLDGFWELLGPERIPGIRSISMDMWVPYINSVRKHVPGADALICFDRFHVAKILNEAVDTVRKRENKELAAAGEEVPKHTKQLWLQNPENMSKKRLLLFRELVHSTLKAARAWAIKDAARWLWSYASRTWAEKAWKQWIGWAQRSQLEPMKRAACTIRDHLWGILNAVTLHATNAAAESTNAKIQRIKNRACGYRNPERFRNAIYFHLGGLDLYPVASATHTNS
jgi:transposase